MTSNTKWASLIAPLLLASSFAGFAQGTAIPKSLDLDKAPGIFAANCSPCHDWAKAYDTVIDPAVIVPGKPQESPAWLALSQDIMPPTGPLSAEDKDLILAWIQAGAPRPSTAAGPSATAGPAGSAAVPAAPTFLGFKSKEGFHRFSGWASGGLLLAAGVVGAVHAYDMWSTAHAYRDSLGIDEFDPTRCPPEISKVYNSPTEQALRWTHIGLLAAGGSFYIANAVTGTSFMGRLGPGWTKAKIHRYAFFTHAALMASEAVMGYFSSQALSSGDHETFSNLLVAHAGVGIAIPVVILGAGTLMDPGIRLR
jgi:hypothetical protein